MYGKLWDRERDTTSKKSPETGEQRLTLQAPEKQVSIEEILHRKKRFSDSALYTEVEIVHISHPAGDRDCGSHSV